MKKYLLEHYPLIWSTRAVPMLIVALGAHLLFFLLGLIASNRGGMGFAEDFWALPHKSNGGECNRLITNKKQNI